MASSHPPDGEANAASMRVKSIGANTREVYRNSLAACVSPGAETTR
jgi:hypothetical protein